MEKSNSTATLERPETFTFPEPAKEHGWLQQLVGEWEYESEMRMGPDKAVQESQGTETVRSIGGFWIIAENHGTMGEKPFVGILSLGYDPKSEKYIGTWIDSVSSALWRYEGAVDASVRVLTLEAEGYCPTAPDKLSKFKDTLEITDKNHRVFTSQMQGEDGQWFTGMTIRYRRKG